MQSLTVPFCFHWKWIANITEETVFQTSGVNFSTKPHLIVSRPSWKSSWPIRMPNMPEIWVICRAGSRMRRRVLCGCTAAPHTAANQPRNRHQRPTARSAGTNGREFTRKRFNFLKKIKLNYLMESFSVSAPAGVLQTTRRDQRAEGWAASERCQ